MTIELALLMLFEGNLYDDKGYVSAEGYKALETLEGVTLTRNIDAMKDDAKQASIPYSYQMPKDYIKNKLDYSRPTVESDKELYEKIETYKNAYRIMSDAFENEVRKTKDQQASGLKRLSVEVVSQVIKQFILILVLFAEQKSLRNIHSVIVEQI